MTVAAPEVQSLARQCASKVRLQMAARPAFLVFAWTVYMIWGGGREVAAHPSFVGHTMGALMQSPDAAVFQIAKLDDSFSVGNVSGVSGEPAKLAIFISEKVRAFAGNQSPGEFIFLKFNGMPEELKFSAGFRFKDAWFVSIKDASGLTLLSPPDYVGLIAVKATLYRGKDAPLQTYTFSVNLQPNAGLEGTARAGPTATPAAPESAGNPQRQPLEEPKGLARASVGPEEEVILLGRADTLFKNGDFESARLIYKELADRGSSKAAFHMAQTFDPDVLKSFFVVGVEPNLEMAQLWYNRAAEHGVTEAEERLKVLSRVESR